MCFLYFKMRLFHVHPSRSGGYSPDSWSGCRISWRRQGRPAIECTITVTITSRAGWHFSQKYLMHFPMQMTHWRTHLHTSTGTFVSTEKRDTCASLLTLRCARIYNKWQRVNTPKHQNTHFTEIPQKCSPPRLLRLPLIRTYSTWGPSSGPGHAPIPGSSGIGLFVCFFPFRSLVTIS